MRSTMTMRPVGARRPEPPEGGGYSAPSVEPLAGVSSPVITAAARRVAQRIRDDGIDPADMDIVAAHVDPVSFRDAPERPERRRQRDSAPPAGAHLQRGARLERPREQRDRAGARRRAVVRQPALSVLDYPDARSGAGHGAPYG